MKKLISIALVLFSLTIQAQKSPLQAVSKETSTKDTIIKTVSYKLYIGSKGGKYIYVVSKSGNTYKKYLKKS